MQSSINLADISDVSIEPFEKSTSIKPLVMLFKHDGKDRFWELFSSHDTITIIIYNVSRKVLVFVKQFRPAVYFNTIAEADRKGKVDIIKYPPEKGVSIELCTCAVDKELPLEEIAKEEVSKECGYLVKFVERVGSFRGDVGYSGTTQTLFYCEVTDEMKVNSGGGIDNEQIEVVEMTVPEIISYINQSNMHSPPDFLYSIYWFLKNKNNS